jgi:hypothetical protein
MMQPCPICGQQPSRGAPWRGRVILRCYHANVMIGTGSWRNPEVAEREWNDGVLALRPSCTGEIYPCPVCGEVPSLHSTDSSHIVQCYHWGSNFIYDSKPATTAAGAIENWNSGI